jgi:hypothetical protein
MKNSSGDILSGLKTKNPEFPSEKVKAASMNSEATRSSVAKSHSIGGRTA